MRALAIGANRVFCWLMVWAVLLGTGASPPAIAQARNVLLLLDGSGSMWTKTSRSTRIEDVRAVVPAVVGKYATKFNLGIAAFGHTGARACGGFQQVSPFGPINQASIARVLSDIYPIGAASISTALKAGAKSLGRAGRLSTMILVADGPDDCAGNPCGVAIQLAKSNPKLQVHVIALSRGANARIPLSCIAAATRGSFVAVTGRRQLRGALDSLLTRLAGSPQIAAGGPLPAPEDDGPLYTGTVSRTGNPPPVPGKKPAPPPDMIMAPRLQPVQHVPGPAARNQPPVNPQSPASTDRDRIAAKPPAPPEVGGAGPAIKPAAPADQPSAPENAGPAIKPAAPQKAVRLNDAITDKKTDRITAPEFIVREKKTRQATLRLTARMTKALEPIRRPVEWTVYRVDTTEKGKWIQIAERKEAHPSITIKPGEYVVQAIYGHASAAKVVTIRRATLTEAIFILNAGALRILPNLVRLKVPARQRATQRIYPQGDNDAAGKPIATATVPGEIVRLNAGRYRIVSKFGAGNSIVKTGVTIRPGRLTEIEINHKAGIARFLLTGKTAKQLAAKARWRLHDNTGALVVEATGTTSPTAILAPGRYKLSAQIDGKTYHSAFTIDAGQTRDVAVEIR